MTTTVRPSLVTRRWLLGALTACAALVSTTAADAYPPWLQPGPPPPPPPPPMITEVWSGQYVCPQGPSNLTLTVRRSSPTVVTAEFNFFASYQGVGGRFLMRGTRDPWTGHVSLYPSMWLARPANYAMVAIDGYVARDGGTFSGRVLSPGCSSFVLRRLR